MKRVFLAFLPALITTAVTVVIVIFWLLSEGVNNRNVVGLGISFALIALLLSILFFVPAIIAGLHEHPNRAAILVLNLFGFMFVPYLIALVWAFTKTRETTTIVVQQPPLPPQS